MHCLLLGTLLHQPILLDTGIPITQVAPYLAQRLIAGTLNPNIKRWRQLFVNRRPPNRPLPDTPQNNTILQRNLNTIAHHISLPWEGNRKQTLT
jgi:hypothetical protein